MIDEAQLTLLVFILARITGFIVFNPLWGRNNVPAMVKAGLCIVLSVSVYSFAGGAAPAVPQTVLEYAVRLIMEFALGFLLGMIMQFFFYVVFQAGQLIDAQMGMNMSEMYDANLGTNVSLTSTLLQVMLVLLFFAAGGHITLLRILLSSGQAIPYGTVSIGTQTATHALEIFVLCVSLAVKLALPILAAELIGQLGMGILMKVIPQINVFVINFELKILLGLLVVLIMLPVAQGFLLDMEAQMLTLLNDVLHTMA